MPIWGNRPIATTIESNESGFQIQPHSAPIAWENLHRVTCFKRDLLTTDLICVELEVAQGKDVRCFEIDEEMSGFDAFMRALLRHFPSAAKNWREAVVTPAFATNLRDVYRRSVDGVVSGESDPK